MGHLFVVSPHTLVRLRPSPSIGAIEGEPSSQFVDMNQYRIIDRLASGSFGVVFKAVRLSDNRVLVLKRVNLANMDERTKQTSTHEVELMQQLHHPHIVQHRDAFLFNEDDLCIVMDYYGGGDLSQIVRTAAEELREYHAAHPPQHAVVPASGRGGNVVRRRGQPVPHPLSDGLLTKAPYLPESRVMLWFVEMGIALHYLHSHRIIHRDLKTQNIFVNTANGEVAVGDFGVAKIAESIAQAHEATPTSTGTPLYMAPEVVQGGHATFKSDVWSLGCILYELLALRHPFASSDLSGLMIRISKGQYAKLPPHFTKPLHRLVDRMLDKDPKKRPLIDEILLLPFVKSYLRTYLSIRVPLESHDAPSEQMLDQQLRALGVQAATETECTEEVLFSAEASPSSPRLYPHACEEPLQLSIVRSYTRPDEPRRLSLEEVNSPTSKYETIHRSHVTEAFSPEVRHPQERQGRKGSHHRTISQPSIAFGGESNHEMMPRANTQQEIVGSAQLAPRRSTSLEAPPISSRHSVANVEDMKGKTIGEIEMEVRKLRELVRHEESSSSGRATTMLDDPTVLASDAVGRGPARLHRRDSSPSGAGDLSYPSRAAMGMLGPNSSVGTQGGEERVPLSRRGTQSTSQFYRLNPEVAASSSNATHGIHGPMHRMSELSKVQRRRQLHQQCVHVLGEKAFHEVYSYYHSVPPSNRDAEVVRHYVPDRACWHVLPIVEAIVQLDREVMSV